MAVGILYHVQARPVASHMKSQSRNQNAGKVYTESCDSSIGYPKTMQGRMNNSSKWMSQVSCNAFALLVFAVHDLNHSG